jgi:hypothetical protein
LCAKTYVVIAAGFILARRSLAQDAALGEARQHHEERQRPKRACLGPRLVRVVVCPEIAKDLALEDRRTITSDSECRLASTVDQVTRLLHSFHDLPQGTLV